MIFTFIDTDINVKMNIRSYCYDHFVLYISMDSVVNVFMCIRNNEDTLQKTFDALEEISKQYHDLEFRYFIYENDSTDNTKRIALAFMRTHTGQFYSEVRGAKEWHGGENIDRSEDMRWYRMKMKNLCTDFDRSKHSVILDTNITFDTSTFKKMTEILDDNTDVHMVTPFGVMENRRTRYYDTYALDIDSKYYGTNLKKLRYEMRNKNLVDLKSGFGGFIMIRTKTLKKCDWKLIPGKVCSEHNGFCEEVLKYGRVVFAKDVKVIWKRD